MDTNNLKKANVPELKELAKSHEQIILDVKNLLSTKNPDVSIKTILTAQLKEYEDDHKEIQKELDKREETSIFYKKRRLNPLSLTSDDILLKPTKTPKNESKRRLSYSSSRIDKPDFFAEEKGLRKTKGKNLPNLLTRRNSFAESSFEHASSEQVNVLEVQRLVNNTKKLLSLKNQELEEVKKSNQDLLKHFEESTHTLISEKSNLEIQMLKEEVSKLREENEHLKEQIDSPEDLITLFNNTKKFIELHKLETSTLESKIKELEEREVEYKKLMSSVSKIVTKKKADDKQRSKTLEELLKTTLQKGINIEHQYSSLVLNLSRKKNFLGWLAHSKIDSNCSKSAKNRLNQINLISEVSKHLLEHRLPGIARSKSSSFFLNIAEDIDLDFSKIKNRRTKHDVIRIAKAFIFLGALNKIFSQIDSELNIAPSRLKHILTSLINDIKKDIARMDHSIYLTENLDSKAAIAFHRFDALLQFSKNIESSEAKSKHTRPKVSW